jgi:four helix bundle protein
MLAAWISHASRTLEAGEQSPEVGRIYTQHMNYRALEVYQRANALFPKVYRLVRSWKQIDQQELGSQMVRAANSIHANIAEGSTKSVVDFKRYLGNGIGSCDELVSHITDAVNVGLISKTAGDALISEYQIVGKQLMRLKQNWK